MKKVTIKVTCPKEHANWELDVVKDIPETLKEWTDTIGENAILVALERYTIIRAQDAGRRAKAGTKSLPSQPDRVVREIVESFRLGARAQYTAHVSPERAKDALLGMNDPNALQDAIKALQKRHAEMVAAEKQESGK